VILMSSPTPLSTGMEQAHRDGNVRLDKPHDDDDDGAEMRKAREIRKTDYDVALQVGGNPMSAETWSADSIVIGQ